MGSDQNSGRPSIRGVQLHNEILLCPHLRSFVYDDNEYLSRRALLSLASLKSDKSEALAERAWESGHLYQRIAALSVLNKISSSKLQEYLKKAHEDGREYLVKNTLKIESVQPVAPVDQPPSASVR
jgi:hypothetical protein